MKAKAVKLQHLGNRVRMDVGTHCVTFASSLFKIKSLKIFKLKFLKVRSIYLFI